MWKFVGVRLLAMVPVLLLVSVLIFSLVYLMPGDSAEIIAGETASQEVVDNIRTELGLDRPFLEQYVDWLSDALTGDFGSSLFARLSVTDAIVARLPATISLTVLSLMLAIAIGVSAGVIAAVRPGGLVDRLATLGASLGQALPNFWVGLVLVLIFALQLDWLPATGYVKLSEDPIGWLRSLAMPAFALGTSASAALARQTRSALVDVLERDYIRAVRAKGMSSWSVVGKHALKNAAIPVVTVLGFQLANLLGGAIIVEQVFAIPGIGSLAITAVNRRDIPMIQGVVAFITLIVVFVNLWVDVAYGFLNPKVRVS